MRRELFRWIVISFVALMISTPVELQAQPAAPPYRFAVQIADGLALYTVDETGEYTLLRDLGDQFAVFGSGVAEWVIPSTEDIVPSPNGRLIAFIAGSTTENALFIYHLLTDQLDPVSVAGYANISWSPDNSAIALSPSSRHVGFSPQIETLTLYNVATSIITALAAPNNAAELVFWSPDSQQLFYVGRVSDCAAPCFGAANWFRVDRTGQNAVQLTDLGNQIITETSSILFVCTPSFGVWSPMNSRFYYALDCLNEEGNRQAYVYSLALNGANRQEADLALLYEDDYDNRIISIIAQANGVYVAITAQPIIADWFYGAWRVLQIVSPELKHTVYEELFDTDLSRVLYAFSMSSNGAAFALTGFDSYVGASNSYLVVGSTEEENSYTAYEFSQPICAASWLNERYLLLTAFSRDVCSISVQPERQFLLDTTTGAIEDVATPIGLVWVIDVPIAAPLLRSP